MSKILDEVSIKPLEQVSCNLPHA